MNRLIIRITNTAILLALLAGVFPAQAVFAERMASGSYTLDSDSVNFGGARSSSASYGIEDTAGEVGTGDLSSSNYTAHAGFQQSSTTAAVTTPTPTPTQSPVNQSGGGSSTGVASGSLLPVNVMNFTATAGQTSVLLDWMYPDGADIVGVRIVRSDKFFPGNPNDGEVIFEGNSLQVIDHDVVPGKVYYYAIFAENSKELFSSGVLAQAKLAVPGSEPLPTDVFGNIPIIDHVDPAIAALTLLDFDFIQDGRKIAHTKDGVVIDAKKNLTVQLDYKKLPEILKTVAISLADPNDSTKVFTFLLRVNKEKNVYEATIAPLGGRGIYKLNAIILDYGNQGLRRITGNLRALALDSVEGILYTNGPAMMYFLFFILILVILVVLLRKRKNHKAAAAGTMIGLLVFMLVSVYPAHAEINKEINYQGKLADSSDNLVTDGTYSMEFKLYTQPSGGSPIWTETRTGSNKVQVTKGLFSILLGEINPLSGVDFNQTLYLGVNIENDGEMSPRKTLGAVPAAFVADTLDGLDSTTFLRIDQGNISTGYFTATSTRASTFPYASTTAATVSESLFLTGLADGCLRTTSGLVSSQACGAGSGGGSWSTTTSQVAGEFVNYSNNATDIVTIGSNSTTTAEFYFDPNTLTAKIGGLLNVVNILATGSTTLQNFTALNGTTTNATTTSLFASTASTTNLFATNGNVGTLNTGNLTAGSATLGGATIGTDKLWSTDSHPNHHHPRLDQRPALCIIVSNHCRRCNCKQLHSYRNHCIQSFLTLLLPLDRFESFTQVTSLQRQQLSKTSRQLMEPQPTQQQTSLQPMQTSAHSL
jgi:hypothetical protein